MIAPAIVASGQYPSLQYNLGGWPVCFDEFGQPIPYEANVFAAYERLFPGGQNPDPVPSDAQAIAAETLRLMGPEPPTTQHP